MHACKGKCMYDCKRNFFNQLYAVFHIQQSRQREPSVKILCSGLSPIFSRYCLFIIVEELQTQFLPLCQSEEMKILKNNNLFPRDQTHYQTCLQSHFVLLRHDWPRFNFMKLFKQINQTGLIKHLIKHMMYTQFDFIDAITIQGIIFVSSFW